MTDTAAPTPLSASNVISDPTRTLQTFTLNDLAIYTAEPFSPAASKDFRLFFVGCDDVHDIFKHILSRVRRSLKLNQFGFDDGELNDIIMALCLDPNVLVQITLDKSQAGGVHEAKLLAADRANPLAGFNTHFVVGNSATGQISHTKGFVADSIVSSEGSTNWSASGEGIFKVAEKFQGGFVGGAQNNTATIFTDAEQIARFSAELDKEHLAAAKAKVAA